MADCAPIRIPITGLEYASADESTLFEYMASILYRSLEAVKGLFENTQLSPNICDGNGTPALVQSVKTVFALGDKSWGDLYSFSHIPCSYGYLQHHFSSKHSSFYISEKMGCELISILLQYGADIDKTDKNGETAAIWASKLGLLQCLKLLVEAGADLSLRNSQGYNALMMANLEGEGRCLEYLVETIQNQECETLTLSEDIGKASKIYELLCAIKKADLERVNALLSSGLCSANAYTAFGSPIIVYVMALIRFTEDKDRAKSVVYQLLRILLNHGVQVDNRDTKGLTATMRAAMYGFVECLSLLVESGIAVDQRNSCGESLLMMLAKGGHKECMTYFLDKTKYKGLNHQDNSGKSALMFAVGLERPDFLPNSCTEILLREGADLELRDCNGSTALMHAIWTHRCGHWKNWTKTAVKMLLSAGACVNVVTKDNTTPLIAAIRTRNFDCVDMLLEAGADLEARDSENFTALSRATLDSSYKVVESLIERGACVNVITKDLETPLSMALSETRTWYMRPDPYRFNLPFICKLFDHGAEMTLASQEYSNSMIALRKDHVLQKMVENGGVPLLYPCSGVFDMARLQMSPLAVALAYNHPGAARYLLANQFLTRKDIVELRSSEEIQKILDISRRNMRETDEMRETQELIQLITCKPWTLLTLSFVAVCHLLQPSSCTKVIQFPTMWLSEKSPEWINLSSQISRRKEKILLLPLPPAIKDKLLFVTATAKLQPEVWRTIPLNNVLTS